MELLQKVFTIAVCGFGSSMIDTAGDARVERWLKMSLVHFSLEYHRSILVIEKRFFLFSVFFFFMYVPHPVFIQTLLVLVSVFLSASHNSGTRERTFFAS